MRARDAGRRSVISLTHLVGRATRRFYFEDFVRVYPGRVAYNRLGVRRRATDAEARNFRNHAKVYEFAAQFVRGKTVVDVGCGAGYGAQILRDAGAVEVHACDVSAHSLRFARRHYGSAATFTRQTIVDLSTYADDSFDVVVSSEVLEHIKEYGLEQRALGELRRIVRPGGLVIVGTPNSELLRDHGFSYDELSTLLGRHFGDRVLLFENALVPFEDGARAAWDERARSGRTGTVVSTRIDLGETILPPGVRPELKRGLEPGRLEFDGYAVDTTLLHNTHGWLALAVKGNPDRRG
jgi:2-polyprenyl-3-methyl-5-hydroxy-6-metoxy-1,4-benzoquinol methylase